MKRLISIVFFFLRSNHNYKNFLITCNLFFRQPGNLSLICSLFCSAFPGSLLFWCVQNTTQRMCLLLNQFKRHVIMYN